MKLLTLGCLLLLLCGSWLFSMAANAEPPAASKQTFAGINTIVFIDKKYACPCTESRINSSWKTLQQSLKDHNNIRVMRIHFDTDKQLAEQYMALKPLMVLPGIYFLNAQGKVVELLQGEVQLNQIMATLKKNAPTT